MPRTFTTRPAKKNAPRTRRAPKVAYLTFEKQSRRTLAAQLPPGFGGGRYVMAESSRDGLWSVAFVPSRGFRLSLGLAPDKADAKERVAVDAFTRLGTPSVRILCP